MPTTAPYHIICFRVVLCTTTKLIVDWSKWVIRVAPTGSKTSPNVRYAFNSDRIGAPPQSAASGQSTKSLRDSLLKQAARQTHLTRAEIIGSGAGYLS
jgi:hypothetical protein